jgi:hypothetical protein
MNETQLRDIHSALAEASHQIHIAWNVAFKADDESKLTYLREADRVSKLESEVYAELVKACEARAASDQIDDGPTQWLYSGNRS